MVQTLVPHTKVVKTFTLYGFENFEDSSYPADDVKSMMRYCSEDSAAKAVVGVSRA
jgi:predicted dinucleotide-binding enzyme